MGIGENIVVGATIIRREDGLVLVKEDGGPADGLWNIPAGRLEVSESIQECAIREAKEESGLNISLESFVGVYTRSDPENSRQVIVFVFSGEIKSGKLQPNAEDISEVKEVPIHSLYDYTLRSEWIHRAVTDYQVESYPVSIVKSLPPKDYFPEDQS